MASNPRRFELAEWTVSEADGTLSREGEQARLEPKVMQVLLLLAGRAGQVVSKEEIFETVWSDTVVEDGVLPQAIHAIRKALGDRARSPSYIETIPRRGYRLIAEVVETDVEGDMPSSPASGRAEPALRNRRRLRLALVAAGVLGILTLVLWVVALRWDETAKTTAIPRERELLRMVVLPVLVHSLSGEGQGKASQEMEWLTRGMTEAITTRMASGTGIAVIPQAYARQYAADIQAASTAGRDSPQIDYYLESSLLLGPDDAPPRLSTRLVSVHDRSYIWTQDYVDVFARPWEICDEIVSSILTQVGVTHRVASADLHAGAGIQNEEAYAFYLRGLGQKAEVGYTEGGIDLALSSFQQAVDLEPNFVDAYAQMVDLHVRHYINYDRKKSRQSLAFDTLLEAQEAETRLREKGILSTPLPSVWLATASYRYGCLNDYEGALELYLKVAEARPGSPEPWKRAAYAARRKGDLEAASLYFEKARDRNPEDYLMLGEMAETLQALGRHAEADERFEEALDLAAKFRARGGGDLETEIHMLGERAVNAMIWTGTVEAARLSLMRAERAVGSGHPGAQATDPAACVAAQGVNGLLIYGLFIESLDQAPEAALRRLEGVPPRCHLPFARMERFWREALAYRELERPERAREVVLAELPFLRRQVEQDPDFHFYHAYLGVAHALLGDSEQALTEGLRAVELARYDRYTGPRNRELLALIYTLLGDHQHALEELRALLSAPYQHGLTPFHLRHDPAWKPLQGQDAFQRLAAR